MSFQRLYLKRRPIDPWIVAIGFAALTIMSGVGKAVFVLFAMGGLYLALVRPASWRRFPPAFTLAVAAYALWAIGLALLRDEPILGNRQMGYSLIQLASIFLPLCLCLVRHPLDAMVTGCRIGILLLLVVAPIEYLWYGERVGFGGNEAILAFTAAMAGIAARMNAVDPVRFLPNGRWWTYLSLLPVVLTQTRAAFIVFVLVALFDLMALFRSRVSGGRAPRLALIAAVLVAGAAAIPLSGPLAERLAVGQYDIQSYIETGRAEGSLGIRLVMTTSALRLIPDHPLAGIGPTERMERVAALSGENADQVRDYSHLHNFVLDEALSHGMIGVALLGLVFATFVVTVFRRTADGLVRETVILHLALVFSFGSFHGVLINEWMLMMTFGFMAIVLAELGPRFGRGERWGWTALKSRRA